MYTLYKVQTHIEYTMVYKSISQFGISLIIIIILLLFSLGSLSLVKQQEEEQQAMGLLYDSLSGLFNDNNYGYNNNRELLSKNASTSFNTELSRTDTNNMKFGNNTNLSNNSYDSVYGQVSATSEKDVYIVWQDSVPGNNKRNYDIFFKKSIDGGALFSKEINLSNNNGFSEHPQISASENNVYIVWADDTYANRAIFFTKSTDGGNTFGSPINLSNNTGDSHNQEIVVFGDNVYIVWQDKPSVDQTSSNIFFKSSTDGGITFSQTFNLSNNANDYSFPKVAAYNDHVYVLWNVEESEKNTNKADKGLFFVKSFDQGSSFGDTIRLNHPEQEFGEAQIAASRQDVYVVWGGSDLNTVNNPFFTKSTDSGETFSDPIAITDDDNDNNNNNLNPSNVEIAVDQEEEEVKLYIAWQALASAATATGSEEEIFFKMSPDKGDTFTNTINLSKNHGVSECPSLAVYKESYTWYGKTLVLETTKYYSQEVFRKKC